MQTDTVPAQTLSFGTFTPDLRPPLDAERQVPKAGYHPGEALPKQWGKWVDIGDLSVWDWNPPKRQISDTKYRETRESMGREGQVEPVVVQFGLDRTPHVVDGNRRLRAADELGWPKIWIVELPLTKDPTRVAAVRNMKQRTWSTNELMALAMFDPTVVDQLNNSMRWLYERMHREVPEEDARIFASKYAMTSVNVVRRMADYGGTTFGEAVHYVLTQEDGILTHIRRAFSMKIQPHRLRTIILEGLPPEQWWGEVA